MLRFCTCLTFYISYLLTVFSLTLKTFHFPAQFLDPCPNYSNITQNLSKIRPEKLAKGQHKNLSANQ